MNGKKTQFYRDLLVSEGRKCVACVKSESYLLLTIPNSHSASALEGLALGEKK